MSTDKKMVKSKYKNAKISPSKVVNIANELRGKKVNDGLRYLQFSDKKAAGILYEIVRSAVANGTNNLKMEEDNLHIQDVLVGPGHTHKWRIFAARGRYKPLLRRTSNITVVLKEDSNEQKS